MEWHVEIDYKAWLIDEDRRDLAQELASRLAAAIDACDTSLVEGGPQAGRVTSVRVYLKDTDY